MTDYVTKDQLRRVLLTLHAPDEVEVALRALDAPREQPADPLPELPHACSNTAASYELESSYRELRTYAAALRERCERAEQLRDGWAATAVSERDDRERVEAELAALKADIASLAHPVCKWLLADKAQAERDRDEWMAKFATIFELELPKAERERDEARAAIVSARADERERCVPVATVACFDGVSGRGEVEWMDYNMNDLGHVLERGEKLYAIRALGKEEGK